jgi:hypothetical protein
LPNTRITAAEAAALRIESTSRYELTINRIIEAAGEFVPIDPATLAGSEIVSKQSALLRAARNRKLRICTTTRKKGVIFARLVVPSE